MRVTSVQERETIARWLPMVLSLGEQPWVIAQSQVGLWADGSRNAAVWLGSGYLCPMDRLVSVQTVYRP